MNTSANNGIQQRRQSFRRTHRWIGVSVVAFVLFLSVSGIALNHSVDFGLDRHYVRWPWLLDAYGFDEPAPYPGMVSLDSLVVVGDGPRAHVLLTSGELVESIDVGAILPGDIERVGRVDDRAVLQSGGELFRSDTEVSIFEPWSNSTAGEIEWSAEVPAGASGLEALNTAWRGPGLTVERVLLDLHSGRIFAKAGTLLMDLIAVFMVVLSVSGLFLSRARNRRRSSPK